MFVGWGRLVVAEDSLVAVLGNIQVVVLWDNSEVGNLGSQVVVVVVEGCLAGN